VKVAAPERAAAAKRPRIAASGATIERAAAAKRPRIAASGAAIIAVAAIAACGKKASEPSGPPPEVTGLAAVPANVEGVIAVDVGRMVGAPLIDRAVDQLLLHDPTIAERWNKLRDTCKIDFPKQVKRVMVALGSSSSAVGGTAGASVAMPASAPGTGPVILVATGNLVETELAKCVEGIVGGGGGSVSGKSVESRTLYQVKDGNRTMFFAFGRPDTVVMGANEAYVGEAVGGGKKAPDNPELGKWLALVDQNAPIWAVGRVDERVRAGLLKVTGNSLGAGPVAFVATLDPSEGAKFELGVVMADAKDANTLESYAKQQLGMLGMAAQMKSMGKIVDKVAISSKDNVVRFKVALTIDDVNRLFCLLDGTKNCEQDAAPAQGSGSGK